VALEVAKYEFGEVFKNSNRIVVKEGERDGVNPISGSSGGGWTPKLFSYSLKCPNGANNN